MRKFLVNEIALFPDNDKNHDFEAFEQMCRAIKAEADRIKAIYDEKVAEHNRLYKEQQILYGECFQPISKWNWSKFKRDFFCPSCGKKLSEELITEYKMVQNDVILSCKCGYKYAV